MLHRSILVAFEGRFWAGCETGHSFPVYEHGVSNGPKVLRRGNATGQVNCRCIGSRVDNQKFMAGELFLQAQEVLLSAGAVGENVAYCICGWLVLLYILTSTRDKDTVS